jgi:hypothetical protein
VAWCKFFIPKIASPGIKPDDPDLNDHIMYAKCIKGHVLTDANDWVLCENLPAPDAKCWQEGGETLFSLRYRQHQESQTHTGTSEQMDDTATQAAKS